MAFDFEEDGSLESAGNLDFDTAHKTCLDAVSVCRDIAEMHYCVTSGQHAGWAAQEVFGHLFCLASWARLLGRLSRDVRTRLRDVALENEWDFAIGRRVDAGAHFVLMRTLDDVFVRSMEAVLLFGGRDEDDAKRADRRVEFARMSEADAVGAVLGQLGARPLIGCAKEIDEVGERLTLRLEREAREFNRLAGKALRTTEGCDAPTVVVDQRLRRVTVVNGDREDCRLLPRQMDFVMLCLLAYRSGRRFRSSDFTELGGIGNPDSMYARLPRVVRDLIDSKRGQGRRLKCDARVVEPGPLSSGQEIDWEGGRTRPAAPRVRR